MTSLETTPVSDLSQLKDNDIAIHQNGNLVKPVRLDNGLYAFKDGTGFDRVVLRLCDLIDPWRRLIVDRDRKTQRCSDC